MSETLAQIQWRTRKLLPTGLSSAELRGVARQVRERAVFSSRLTNAHAVQELADVVDDMLSGKIGMEAGRTRMWRKLRSLGYDPASGFPGEEPTPPAEPGSLRDLSSERRLTLMLETNLRMAANFGKMTAGNSGYALREYPAWELARLHRRDVPRGSPESHSAGWDLRWSAAGDATGWQGALKFPWVARKDSPLWQALGDGAGGYMDTLGNPYPPFAFNSGLGWREVSRDECQRLWHTQEVAPSAPMEGELSPGRKNIQETLERLGPEFRAALLAELEEAVQ